MNEDNEGEENKFANEGGKSKSYRNYKATSGGIKGCLAMYFASILAAEGFNNKDPASLESILCYAGAVYFLWRSAKNFCEGIKSDFAITGRGAFYTALSLFSMLAVCNPSGVKKVFYSVSDMLENQQQTISAPASQPATTQPEAGL